MSYMDYINDIDLKYLRKNNIGKHMFAECRGTDPEYTRSRLFIQRLDDLDNMIKKEGWWDTFTLANTVLDNGLYLVRILDYRSDKNGNIICEVIPVKIVSFTTWEFFKCLENPLTKVLVMNSGRFIDDYRYTYRGIEPNFKNLVKNVPDLSEINYADIPKKLFELYVSGGINFLSNANHHLSKLSPALEVIANISTHIAHNTLETAYGEKYPLLCKKIWNNITHLQCPADEVKDYVYRQIRVYEKEINIDYEDTVDGIFEAIESVLQYREKQKEAKKAEKRNKRKEGNK